MSVFRLVFILGLVMITALISNIIGWHTAPRWFRKGESQELLQIQPSRLELVSPVEEGTAVKLPLMINNDADSRITINKVSLSCRCSAITGLGNKPLMEPFEVRPKSAIPVQLSIDTRSAEGDIRVSILVEYEKDGVIRSTRSDIKVHVLPQLKCIVSPAVIRDPGDGSNITGSILLGDSLPGNGVQIESVSSTIPTIVTTECIPIPNDLAFSTNDDSPEYLKRFRKRYKIVFSFDSRTRAFNENINIRPVNKSIAPSHISLVYEGWQGQAKIYPPEVLMQRTEGGQVLHREIRFVGARSRQLQSLAVVSSPEWVKTRIVSVAQNEWSLQLALSPPGSAAKDATISLANEAGQLVATIPVRFIGALDRASIPKPNGR